MIGWLVVSAWGSDPEELLHLARERIRHGDYEGVRIVANQALEIPGDHQRTAQFLIAMSLDYGGDPEQALALYDALSESWPASEVPDELRFQRAECLGRLTRYDEAADELHALSRADRPAEDELVIELLAATFDFQRGKSSRKLEKVLARAQPGAAAYYQASARDAILDRAVAEANAIPFAGSDRAKAKALERRAALIHTADEQLAEIIRTEETRLALDGFVENARARVRLGHDLLAESPLTRLTEEQRELNRRLLAEKVEQIWVKASLYYDRGMQLAARMDWTAEPVPTMKAEYDALIAEVDRL
jgi:hypothetical protein